MLGKDTLGLLKEWRKTTGDIYSIYMGPKLAVVLSSYQLLKEAFIKNGDYFSDRPHRFVDTDERFAGGLIDTSGPVWKEQRGVAISILKKLGMGKNVMGEKVNREVKAYLEYLTKTKGEPLDARPLTNACVSNVIGAVLTGNRLELDDPQLITFFEALDQQVKNMQGTSILRVFPWLKYLPGDLFNAKALVNNEELLTKFCSNYINKLRETHEGSTGENFIHSYLTEEKLRKESSQETTLNNQNLTMVVSNLFQAGSETSTTLMWVMLYAIHYPDIQRKLYEEIKETLGTERLPNVEDRPRLKYVNAYLMETQRLANIAPLGLPHLCPKTTNLRGYTIPAGTIILPHLYAILHDEKNWGDPMVFRPQRFLDDEGNLVVPEYFIPFSIGRRNCVGEALAKLELFLFTTGIIQFQLLPEDPDNLPSLNPIFGITCSPKPYKIRFVPRH